MAISTKGDRRVPFPCTWRELQRNAANGPKGIPIGAVFFWVKTVAELPNGCVLMDCKANSIAKGGSGINMIDAYFKCTKDDAVGPRYSSEPCPPHPAEPLLPAGRHNHDVTLYSNDFDVDVDIVSDTTGITLVPAGQHHHLIHAETLEISKTKDLDKSFNTSEVDLVIDPHNCADIVRCILPHPPHSHEIDTWRGDLDQGDIAEAVSGFVQCSKTDVEGGGPVNNLQCNGPMLDLVDGFLTHKSTGQDVDHTYTWSTGIFATKPTRHFHDFFVDVNHSHTFVDGPLHDHGGVTVLVVDHNHLIEDEGHIHDTVVGGTDHNHNFEFLEELDHTHDPGEPQHIHLVPVERIF